MVDAVIKQRSRKEMARLQDKVEQYLYANSISIDIAEEEYNKFLDDIMTFIACERDTFDNDEDLIFTAVFQTLEKRRQYLEENSKKKYRI